MNFLLRQSQAAAAVTSSPSSSLRSISSSNQHLPPPSPLTKTPSKAISILDDKSASTDNYGGSTHIFSNHGDNNLDMYGDDESFITSSSSDSNFAPLVDNHVDVTEDQGWITIPFKKLPDDWVDASNMHGFRSLDRSFVFPGEQVPILACLSASKQDCEIITPFKVAALMNKNVVKDQKGNMSDQESSSGFQQPQFDDLVDAKNVSKPSEDVSASESFLRMENHKKQTQTLLQRFKDSHFFVRIAESGEQLWSKKGSSEASNGDAMLKNKATTGSEVSISAMIDNGSFDARGSGGAARNSVKCCSLMNGDIVVLLRVNVGIGLLKDPVLEILQFEKHHDGIRGLDSDADIKEVNSPGELLKWLLPLENSHLPVNRSLSPPLMNVSHKSSFKASNSSPLFSLPNLRSYSMSSLPQNVAPAASPSLSGGSPKPNFDLEDWGHFMSQKSMKSPRSTSHGVLSFRGVPLEPERFSVSCGLEGIYIPGRRWRKPLDIIQPVDIHTFVADCNTDDLLSVQIKNVSPAHIPDIVVFIDAITIILEGASKGGPPLSVPVACIEAGTDHCLPNLALRRGEEHSFILKPATTMLNRSKDYGDRISQFRSKGRSKAASMCIPPTAPTAVEATTHGSPSDKYAVLVSCRCNYSESKLFFKKSIDWRPRISRDFMLSVAIETSTQTCEISSKVSQLPVQVLTLQASNFTSEDLNLTIIAPASFTPPPPSPPPPPLLSPASPFAFATTQKLSSVPLVIEIHKRNDTQSEQPVPVAHAPTSALNCTHLWLHSRVPLGCVPSQTTAAIKLELLPLTDGIIALDTLQIYVKEKGATYIPQHALKINATSSIATGIV